MFSTILSNRDGDNVPSLSRNISREALLLFQKEDWVAQEANLDRSNHPASLRRRFSFASRPALDRRSLGPTDVSWKQRSWRTGGGRRVGRRRKLLERILGGRSDANIPFEQTRTLLKALGGSRRASRAATTSSSGKLINLQNVEGKCKPYQVRQMRDVLLRYNLEREL